MSSGRRDRLVSSHGLHQGRLDGFQFDAAVLTNLTQNHLNYHKSMDDHFAATLLLTTERLKTNGTAIINTDDEYGVCCFLGRRDSAFSEKGRRGFRREPAYRGRCLRGKSIRRGGGCNPCGTG